MVSHLSGLCLVFAALFLLGSALAVPLANKLRSLSPDARGFLKRTIPSVPRFLVYNDLYLDQFPTASQLSGFNVFALAFLMTSGATDQAQAWSDLSDSERTTYLNKYNAAGISLIVSAFGSTDAPTSAGYNAVTLANTMASWVLRYKLHGIDIDYEDFNAFDGSAVLAESWLISFTRELRTHLPQGQYILTHVTAIAPWFSPNTWNGGGYLAIDSSIGNLIDWYNIQFYNQGEYTTCNGLLHTSTANSPQSSLFELAANGIPLDKLVIGKPGKKSDADDGYMPASTLAMCVSEAVAAGWDAGVMVWEYHDIGSSWIKQVRGNTFKLK